MIKLKIFYVVEEVDLSYYGSIFSNLSRGLPIEDGVSNTESPNREDEGDNSNPITQVPQQEQELQTGILNINP